MYVVFTGTPTVCATLVLIAVYAPTDLLLRITISNTHYMKVLYKESEAVSLIGFYSGTNITLVR